MAEKIVYRLVPTLLAIAAIPIVIFTPIIRIVGDFSIGQTYIGEDVSFYDIYELFFSPKSTFSGFGGFKLTDPVRATMPALITSGALLAAAILLGIAAAVTAIVCRRKLPGLILSACACLCVIGTFIAFNRFFATPYVDGTISVGNLGFMEEGILESLFSALVNLELLKISSAGFFLFGLYAAMFVWIGAFMLVEIGEPAQKKKSR